ncbi:MAG: hypothetical protein K9J25_11560 [Bacteroidales bacterium]|nr:hypothetical protein [Bacteroidales bacterium]
MNLKNKLLLISLFAIAMAFLESSVVVYLRELLYPEGFSFPLKRLAGGLALTEILRELATLVMLITVSLLAGRKFSVSFAWFLYSFAIWDIFYYAFLKALLDWPASLLEWDILFLIPLTWTGPVLSPLIVCVLMIVLAGVIIYFSQKGIPTKIKLREWLILIAGALVVILSFTWDYSGYILREYSLAEIWNIPVSSSLLDYATAYIPGQFNWWLFSSGSVVILSAITLLWYRLKNKATKRRSD